MARSAEPRSPAAPRTQPRLAATGLFSHVGRLILSANTIALALVALGFTILSDTRNGLVHARLDALTAEGRIIAGQLQSKAVERDERPALDATRVREALLALDIGPPERARVVDPAGAVIADTYLLKDLLETKPLPGRGRHAFHPLGAIGEAISHARDGLRRWSLARAGLAAFPSLEAERAQALGGEVAGGERADSDGRRVVSVSLPIQPVSTVIGVLTLEANDIDDVIAAERRAVIPYIFAAFILLGLLSTVLAYLIARPLRNLANAAEAVRAGRRRDLDVGRLAARRNEIGALAASLTAMTHELNARIRQGADLAADNAHELKNPVQAISSAAQTIETTHDIANIRELAGNIRGATRRMLGLIERITEAAAIDNEAATAPLMPLDLADLLQYYATHLWPDLGQKRRISVHFHCAPDARPAMVESWQIKEAPALDHVFSNLVDNALAFSPEGAAVTITLSRRRRGPIDPDIIRVSVEDEGPGIPDAALERIFERFYTDRAHAFGGPGRGGNTGLGLDIARRIVLAHHGRIWAENRTPEGGSGGARLIVELPEMQ